MGLVYRVFVPATLDSDVVKRTLDVNGNAIDVPVNATYIDLPPVLDGSIVTVKLQDTDDAGNSSEWSSPLVFTARDTLIPATPQGLTTKLVAEVPDEIAPAPEVSSKPTKVKASAVVKPVVDPEPPVEPEQLIDLPPPSE